MEKDPQQHKARPNPRGIGSRIMRPIKKLLFGEIDYDRLFPSELAEEIRNGAPVPVLYSGPLYTQTPEEAERTLAELDAAYAQVTEADASVENNIARLAESLSPYAFGGRPEPMLNDDKT